MKLGAIGEIVGAYRQVLTEAVSPMALRQSAVSELLDAFRAGDGVNLIRDAVRLVLQELVELEATERIGPLRARRVRVTDRKWGRRKGSLSGQAVSVRRARPV